ncbi:MAG: hypothetical protein K6T78_08735 [Alicyclobacillus sp.]|nr:hypothetical protein [Alicyclobacillus sp.]
MNQLLPDWMFAAFAIGAWTLAGWIVRHWHWMPARGLAIAVVAGCALVLAARYVTRFIRHRRNPDTPDPDEWKQY